MKILVLSDLHLSHSPFEVIQNGQRIDQNADVVVLVGADSILTHAPTFDCPTITICYPAPNNESKAIDLGHGKSAPWVKIESAPTHYGLNARLI